MPEIAVFTSGPARGSNLEAMYTFFTDFKTNIRIGLVVATRADAPVLERCERLGLKSVVFDPTDPGFFHNIISAVAVAKVKLVALAGFMRKIPAPVLRQLPPVLNIHPALLPKFGGRGLYGINVHQAVLEAGEQFSGATVHYVDEQYDHGTIIAQQRVYIYDCATPEEIAARVLKIEHRLYGYAIWSLCDSGLINQAPRLGR